MARKYAGVPKQWVRYNEHGEGPGNRRDKRCRFVGPSFYSYETIIARYHQGVRGRGPYVLACSRRYSPSTGQHLQAALSTVGVPIIKVPFIGAGCTGWARDNEPDHEANIAYLWTVAEAIADEAVRLYRNDWVQRNWRTKLAVADADIMLYMRMVGGMHEIRWTLRDKVDEIARKIADKLDAYNNPKAVAKRERARARRIGRQAMGIVDIHPMEGPY